MNSSEILDIQILKFINPHIFYVTTDLDQNRRAAQLQNISDRLKRSKRNPIIQPPVDGVVAVYHERNLVRATVLGHITNDTSKQKRFSCWLIDHALLINTDQIYDIPKELQKLTPKCNQASLNNICYLHEKLELGVTGTKKLIPGLLPSAGTIQAALELLSNSEKVQMKVEERFGNVLIGEIKIYKNGKTCSLTKELVRKELVAINEVMFTGLKYGTKEFLKSQLVYHSVETAPVKTSRENGSFDNKNSIHKMVDSLQDEIEELDIQTLPPLENGRRRKNIVVTSPTKPDKPPEDDKRNSSVHEDTGSENSKILSPVRLSRLKMLLKKKQEELELRKTSVSREDVADTGAVPKDPLQRLLEFRKRKSRMSESSEDGQSTSGNSTSLTENMSGEEMQMEIEEGDSNQCSVSQSISESENTAGQSPFASVTSQRKRKPKGLFLPAGMERSMTKKATATATPRPRTHKTRREKSPPSADERPEPIEDCATVPVPPKIPYENDTDRESSEAKPEIPEESSGAETAKRDVFTKQDFCKLVNGCSCVKCRISLEDDDWDSPVQFEENDRGNVGKQSTDGVIKIKAARLLKKNSENEAPRQTKISSVNYNEMSSMEKNLSCKVLVHSESIPNPVKRVADVHLHKDLHANVSRINYKESKRIQHYAFPAVTRNQHVFMVNEPKSGKTMAYLPIVLSFVMEKDERYGQLSKLGGGPIVVILCSNSKKCEEVYDLAGVILNRQNRRCNLVTYPRYGNMSNVDVLITMPTVLQTLISSRVTNFKRLCHLILEDADVMLKDNDELLSKFVNYADLVLERRNCPKTVQLIACAQHWTPQLEDVLLKLNKIPTVCIGNHLEAALYGKLKFTLKFLETGCKEQYLQSILCDKFKFIKSVVICNQEEIEDVQNYLMLKGIDYISFLNESQAEDILYYERVWNDAHPGNYSVLICNDELYNTMSITSAHLLVHFSLPYSWAQFTRRFSCFLESVRSPLIDLAERKIDIASYVLIDENCEERMPKFSNFIKIAGLEKELPDKMKTFFKQTRIQEEQNRVSKRIDLCHTLKVFGHCRGLNCKKRHFLNEHLDRSDLAPRNGSIRFKILKMLDAGSCSIRISESFDLNGNSVQKYDDSSDVIASMLAKKFERRPVSKPILSHLYLIEEKGELYRCKLVENYEFPLVFCVDKGIYRKGALDRLFKMPEELKKIPPQCVEIHFAHLIPPFEDTRFSRSAGIKAEFLKDSNCPDAVMTGTIVLQLGNILWLEDVYELREMYDKTLPNIGFQLSRELVKEGLAVKNTKPLEKLYGLCEEFHIDLPEFKVAKPAVRKVIEAQVVPDWAFLHVDEVHEVTFTFAQNPQEFYVRQNKFQKQLEDLERLIQKQVRKPFYPSLKEVKVGHYYLYPDEVTKEYSRGLVLEMTEDEVRIMSVDYGDVCWLLISNLKFISDELILKLPFQAIRCSLTGVGLIEGDWSEGAVDLLYKMAYEDDLRTRLRLLYVKIDSRQDNPLGKRQNCYSVTLKDGFEGRVLINELLIDCGFALPNGDEINDFDLPDIGTYNEEHDDSVEEVQQIDQDIFDGPNSEFLDLSNFDCVLFDPERMLIDAKVARRIENGRASTNNASDSLPVIKAVPEVGYLTPTVVWSQTDDHLKLNIQVADVTEPKIGVKHSRLFQFSASKTGKEYALKLYLYARVGSTCQHAILGHQIRVTLKKCVKEEWPRLLKTTDKMRKISYDPAALKVDDDKPKRFLDLGISDSSSAEDDEYYYAVSDLDSDYDYDIPNDEE